MRILISALSCNCELGSEALVGYKCAEALGQAHDVTILASPPSQTPEGCRLIACDAGNCSLNDVNASALLRFEIRQFFLSRTLHRHNKFDVVHRVTPSAIQQPTLLPMAGVPLVIGPLIAADPPPPAFTPFLRRPTTRPARPRLHPLRVVKGISSRVVHRLAQKQNYLGRASRILIGNAIAAARMRPEWRAKCRRLAYSGVEHKLFAPPQARQPTKVLQLLYVGRLIPYKGVELLLRAVAVASGKCALQLRVIGSEDPVFGNYCRNLVAELGVAKVIQFEQPLPRLELVVKYQQADVFCFPTLCDTYGVALLEAMSCGCAVVVSDAGGAGEIVNGDNGIKVALTNPEQYVQEYAARLIALAGNRSRLRELGEAARAHVRAHHDWAKIGGDLRRVYEELETELTKPI